MLSLTPLPPASVTLGCCAIVFALFDSLYRNKYIHIDAGSAKAGGMGGFIEKGPEAFPKRVRSDIGQALYAAQMGETDPAAKPLKGLAARV